jgi:hypothetical protein
MLHEPFCDSPRVKVADHTFSIDEIGRRHTIDTESILDFPCVIKPRGESEAIAVYEFPCLGLGIVYCYADKGDTFALVVLIDLVQYRALGAARHAPGSEKVDHYGFTLVVAQFEITALQQGQVKVRGHVQWSTSGDG